MGGGGLGKLVVDAVREFSIAHDRWPYSFGTEILYRMCQQAPTHDCIKTTISKLWLIGRSYAAALERRRDKNKHPDPYLHTAQALKADRGLSTRFAVVQQLKNHAEAYTAENALLIGDTVDALAERFEEHTGLRKISLASKYLHFHQPFVPIFDSYNSRVLVQHVARDDVADELHELWARGGYPRHVARFVTAFGAIREQGIDLTAASLDVLLLHLGGYTFF